MHPSLLRLSITTMAFATAEALVRVVTPPYLQLAGLTVDLVGLLVSLFAVSALLSRLPAGLAYRTSRAPWLLRGALLLMATGALLYPLSHHLAVLVAARVLGGLGFGIATTTALAATMELAPGGSSHRPVAAYATILVVGYGTGLALGGAIADLGGYQAAFWSATTVALLGMAAVPRLPRGARQRAQGSHPRTARQRTQLRVLTHPGLASAVLTAFVLNYLLSTSMTYFPLYALAVGLSLTEISAIVGLHSLCQIVARPVSGEATRRLGHRRMVNGGIILLVAAYVLIPSFSTLAPLAALFISVGLLRAGSVVANTIALAEDVPEEEVSRGTAAGLFNAAKDLGDIVGPLLSGLVAAQIGVGPLFSVVPPAMLAFYGLTWLALRRLQRPSARTAPGV